MGAREDLAKRFEESFARTAPETFSKLTSKAVALSESPSAHYMRYRRSLSKDKKEPALSVYKKIGSPNF